MSNKQNDIIEENKIETEEEQCKFCINLDEMCWECPREPHKGESANCDECGAEYYRPYHLDDMACNDKAKQNHPELEKL